ncbi:hypothetical protein GAMM_170081 [Gammaproteobacteria bacterium]
MEPHKVTRNSDYLKKIPTFPPRLTTYNRFVNHLQYLEKLEKKDTDYPLAAANFYLEYYPDTRLLKSEEAISIFLNLEDVPKNLLNSNELYSYHSDRGNYYNLLETIITQYPNLIDLAISVNLHRNLTP